MKKPGRWTLKGLVRVILILAGFFILWRVTPTIIGILIVIAGLLLPAFYKDKKGKRSALENRARENVGKDFGE